MKQLYNKKYILTVLMFCAVCRERKKRVRLLTRGRQLGTG